MSEPASRIVDVVLDRKIGRSKQRRAVAFVFAVFTYAGLGAVVAWWDPSLEAWAAEIASHVHSELDRTQPVAIEMPEVPKPEAPKPEPTPPPRMPRQPTIPSVNHAPPAPAQAGNVVTADPSAPADFTNAPPIVTGEGKRYAGGTTTPTGTSERPAPPTAKESGSGTGDGEESKARPVGRRDGEWRCPWPSEAESLDIDAQSATIRVRVSASGEAIDVRSLDDPGYGFGRAARACALSTRWEPALDDDGTPIERWSPPVRVRFERR